MNIKKKGLWTLIALVLAALTVYAVMKGDPDCTFLEEPQDETDNYFQEVFESGADEISAWDVVVTEDEETQALKQTAVDGLHYERGARALAEGDFERAMDIGMPCPLTRRRAQSVEDFLDQADFPLIIKPRFLKQPLYLDFFAYSDCAYSFSS